MKAGPKFVFYSLFGRLVYLLCPSDRWMLLKNTFLNAEVQKSSWASLCMKCPFNKGVGTYVELHRYKVVTNHNTCTNIFPFCSNLFHFPSCCDLLIGRAIYLIAHISKTPLSQRQIINFESIYCNYLNQMGEICLIVVTFKTWFRVSQFRFKYGSIYTSMFWEKKNMCNRTTTVHFYELWEAAGNS